MMSTIDEADLFEVSQASDFINDSSAFGETFGVQPYVSPSEIQRLEGLGKSNPIKNADGTYVFPSDFEAWKLVMVDQVNTTLAGILQPATTAAEAARDIALQAQAAAETAETNVLAAETNVIALEASATAMLVSMSASISAWNANVATATNTFNTNTVTKITEFDANATSKTADFNSNATTKTSTFDSNSVTKTNTYNSNAQDKLDDIIAMSASREIVIETIALVAQSAVTISLPVGYARFRVEFDNVLGSQLAYTILKTSTDDGSTFDSTLYVSTKHVLSTAGGAVAVWTYTNGVYCILDDQSMQFTGKIELTDPRGSFPNIIDWELYAIYAGNLHTIKGAGFRHLGADPLLSGAEVVDAIQISRDVGTFSGGSIKLIGIN